MSSAVPAALQCLEEQPHVQAFLSRAVNEGRLSHAYLFVGAPGSGKTEAALALAQCIVCPNEADGRCDDCIRVAHRTHPDVRVLEPESVTGYLIEQVRELIEDANLAPVRSKAKVYILTNAGLLRGSAANALLKTIEEPPSNVTFILCGRTPDAILPTIVSRCQQLAFRVVSPDAALHAIERACGASRTEARIALAVAGTSERAREFLVSADRRQARRLAVRIIGELAADDLWDVLAAARELVAAAKAPLELLRTEQEAALEASSEYVSSSAKKLLEKAHKRELTAKERSGIIEILAAIDSLIRDVLLRCEGLDEALVNEDVRETVERIALAASVEAVVQALEAVSRAAEDIAHNVTPQLALEVMLLRIKEAF